MTEHTPLEKLDLAIEEFLRDTDQLRVGAFVTGWALGVSTSRVQADDASSLPMVTGASYSLGPQTSIMQFAGLAQYLSVVSEKVIWSQLADDQEEDD